jgi:hypothetical protein
VAPTPPFTRYLFAMISPRGPPVLLDRGRADGRVIDDGRHVSESTDHGG